MELGFIEKLIEMYKYRKILCELKQELKQEQKKLIKTSIALQIKQNLKIMLPVTMLYDANANKNTTYS